MTWGSMLSLAEKALMTDAWWILLIPGAFLVVTLLCITPSATTCAAARVEKKATCRQKGRHSRSAVPSFYLWSYFAFTMFMNSSPVMVSFS